jgi:broad specificity polyphosphatase/5'/3'-nucleotidase SurE
VTAVDDGYVSVTPIKMDMTDYSLLDDMRAGGVDTILTRTLNL